MSVYFSLVFWFLLPFYLQVLSWLCIYTSQTQLSDFCFSSQSIAWFKFLMTDLVFVLPLGHLRHFPDQRIDTRVRHLFLVALTYRFIIWTGNAVATAAVFWCILVTLTFSWSASVFVTFFNPFRGRIKCRSSEFWLTTYLLMFHLSIRLSAFEWLFLCLLLAPLCLFPAGLLSCGFQLDLHASYRVSLFGLACLFLCNVQDVFSLFYLLFLSTLFISCICGNFACILLSFLGLLFYFPFFWSLLLN
jgi:hypothetical protein